MHGWSVLCLHPTSCRQRDKALSRLGARVWLARLKKAQAWTVLVRPAAANPLLIFILPGIIDALMRCLNLLPPAALGRGFPGVFAAALSASSMLALAAGLNRLHIKLQL